MLNGKVIASEDVIEIAGFASGSAILIAAGTAIYEQLAARTDRSIAPPTESPNAIPSTVPTTAENSGKTTPKHSKNSPYFLMLAT
jgi:hypothetical protein